VSTLALLLSTVRTARAERVFFAPGEVGLAFDNDDESRPVGDPVARSMLADAVSELLSHEEIQELPSNRPRIVRHEHEGAAYVIELVRGSGGGIALGVRVAKATFRRDPGESPRDPQRDSVRNAQLEEASLRDATIGGAPRAIAMPAPAPAEEGPTRRASKRLRAAKRTVRVELDDEGVPLDATAIDLDGILPGGGPPRRRTSKPFKRPDVAAALAYAQHVQPAAPPGEHVYETRIIPRAGTPATDLEIAGSPSGAHVTFLIAPGGFSLVTERNGAVTVGAIDYAAISGALYIAPTMKLRFEQGAKEGIVTFYRPTPPRTG
jgi:hypothetical protein